MTRAEAEIRLQELEDELNGLSNENAQGNAELCLDRDGNGTWNVKAKGSLCSGVNSDGEPYWRQVDEVLNGDEYWEDTNLSKLLKTVEKVIEEGEVPDDNT